MPRLLPYVALPFFALYGTLSASQAAAPCLDRPAAERPYARVRLIDIVKSQTPVRAEYLIRTCGVRVAYDNELENELRKSGAEDTVIAAVRDVAPKPLTPVIEKKLEPTPVVETKPETACEAQPTQERSNQAVRKTWKDGEYDFANSALSDQSAPTRLPKLDAWKARFPETEFETERRETYLATYQALRKAAEVYATAKEILAKDPDNLVALTALIIFIYQFQPPSVADLEAADRAANSLLNNKCKYFALERKPQGVTDDKWAAARKEILADAQNCLAWTATQRKDWDKAEIEYVKILQMQPTNLEATYRLATAIISQKKVDKYPIAIFHLARAANYTGQGALPENSRKSIQVYFEKQYVNYHGDKSDIEKVVAVAVANVLPPSDFKIKSVVEIQKEKDDAAAAAALADPAGAMWKQIRDALTGDGGQAYFDGSIKGAGLPGGANGVTKFKGKLVSATPETNPKELVLGITDGKVAEVTLKLDAALRGKMDVGTEIGFEGVPSAFVKDPFMLTFDVEKAKITGWTAGPAPAQKKGPVAPRPPLKKK